MKDNMNEIPSGGIGIKVIGKIADEISYTRTCDSRNCLFIVKYYQKQQQQQPGERAGYLQRAIDALDNLKWSHQQRDSESEHELKQPLQKIRLDLNTDLKAVAQILGRMEQLESFPIPEAVLHQFKLAAVEGFTNAVRHAHKNLPEETPIEIEIKVFNERLEISIWDLGKPFDFQAKLLEELAETSSFSF
ncbi:MAG: ATP-binding protein [Microcoleus sp.]